MTYLIMHSQRHWQRSSFPLLIIENRSGKQLPCTARQCTIKCIELFCLRRSYGDNSSSVVGFVLPDLHQAHKNLHTTIACKNQNAAIKVRVKWNSSILKFDINYKVLECKKVMESIYSRIKHWRDCLLHSEGKFGYFFKLTDTELVAARYTF
jgi:hypothetical protein